MYVVYSICLYFLSIFLLTYNKNHLSKKKIVGRSKLANVVLVHGCIFWYVVEF